MAGPSIEDLIEAAVGRALTGIREEIAALRRALPPTLGSLHDAAKVLHCDRSTVYRAWKRGEIAGRQIGGRIFIDLAALRPATQEKAAAAGKRARRRGRPATPPPHDR